MKPLLLTLLSAFLFQGLFWNELLGLNCLMVTMLVLILSFYHHPQARRSKWVMAAAAGTVFTALMVVINNSLWSKWIFALSIWMFAGLAAQPKGKFPVYALFTYFWNLSQVPGAMLKRTAPVKAKSTWTGRIFGLHFAYFALPLVITLAFLLIYLGSNPDFSNAVESVTTYIFDFLDDVFFWLMPQLDLSWLLFFFMGLLMMGAIVYGKSHYWLGLEASYSLNLLRERRKRPHWISYGTALRREHYLSVATLFLLNILTGCVNLIDIIFIWFGNRAHDVENLSQFVHTGTYWLIVSILLAIGILLFIFRANQNYFPQNSLLRKAAYLWIAQNGIMAISVAIRNYHYIARHGLAYKRIGVAVFLILTMIGLFTLFLKISQKQTTYRMMRTNAWVWYASFVALTAVNWDVAITRYNLTANIPEPLDLQFLLEDVSDKNIFLLYEYRATLQGKGYYLRDSYIMDEYQSVEDAITQKKIAFELKMSKHPHWQSWNYPDYRNWLYLNPQTGSND